MEGGQPVVRSDQKGMEEVQRIRETLAKEEPVLSESQVELIKHHTAFLGEDGEAVMREIQEEATEGKPREGEPGKKEMGSKWSSKGTLRERPPASSPEDKNGGRHTGGPMGS